MTQNKNAYEIRLDVLNRAIDLTNQNLFHLVEQEREIARREERAPVTSKSGMVVDDNFITEVHSLAKKLYSFVESK